MSRQVILLSKKFISKSINTYFLKVLLLYLMYMYTINNHAVGANNLLQVWNKILTFQIICQFTRLKRYLNDKPARQDKFLILS